MSRQVRQLVRLAQQLLQLENALPEAQLVLALRRLFLLAQHGDAQAEAHRVLAVDVRHLIKRHIPRSSPSMYSKGLSASRAKRAKQSAQAVVPLQYHSRSPGRISCAQSEQTARGMSFCAPPRRRIFPYTKFPPFSNFFLDKRFKVC